jgi:hypothetical protein
MTVLTGTRLVIVVLLLAFVTPAFADKPQPGLTYDPGSPAGKEYALPLNAARSQGGGGGHSGAVPLFGAGVKPVASSAAKARSGSSTGGGGKRRPPSGQAPVTGSAKRPRRHPATSAPNPATPAPLPALAPGRPARDTSRLLEAGTVAGLAAVLALALGLGYRRVRIRGS